MNQLPRKSLVTANELEALLAKPLTTAGSTDKYFPMRLAILVFFSTIWFIRLTVFTHQIAEDLFSNPAIREYMLPAIYFLAEDLFSNPAIRNTCCRQFTFELGSYFCLCQRVSGLTKTESTPPSFLGLCLC